MVITVDRVLTAGFGRNHSHGASIVEVGAQGIVVEGFVAEKGVEVEVLYQRGDADAVMSLPGQ